MALLVLILWIAAFLCFLAAGFSLTAGRVNPIGLGLALATLAYLLTVHAG